jgi:hypothetical protein
MTEQQKPLPTIFCEEPKITTETNMEFLLLVGGAVIIWYVIKTMATFSKQQVQENNRLSPDNEIQVTMTTSQRVVANSTRDDDDDDLATFSISYGYEEEKSTNKTPGKWVKSGESITIKGLSFTGGNIYFGGKLSSLDGYGTEASLVDDSLKIEKKPSAFEDESLGYWPKFISLTPEGRGAFLCWLSSDRSDPDTPLGYVFIYFYGIERRIIFDSIKQSVDDSEFKALFEEVLRLKGIYGSSRSFSNYSIRLLEIICLLRPHVVSYHDFEKTNQRDSLLFKYQLATAVNEEKPISAELALRWIRFYPDNNLKKPARRCGYEFSQMFKRLYSKKYGNGIVVKPNKTRLKIEYFPASPSLRGITLPQQDLPDPSNLKGPVNKLIAIADECTAELVSHHAETVV